MLEKDETPLDYKRQVKENITSSFEDWNELPSVAPTVVTDRSNRLINTVELLHYGPKSHMCVLLIHCFGPFYL